MFVDADMKSKVFMYSGDKFLTESKPIIKQIISSKHCLAMRSMTASNQRLV